MIDDNVGQDDDDDRYENQMMMMIMIIVLWYWQKGHTICRLTSYDIMMGQRNTTMIAVMTIRHDDAIKYVWWLIVKGMIILDKMMIMIMVIIMILIIVSNHIDDDGDHSNIAQLSLTDDIDGGDKEQDFISMV